MLIFLGVVFMFLFKKINTYFSQPIFLEADSERFYLPKVSGELIHHKYFSLSYLEKHEQAEWVSYKLTVDMLNAPKVPRTNYFNPDYSVSTGSSFHKDYSGSNYTRGHLVPAADMAFDQKGMEESFFMSNISPQKKAFNGGIWRELEELTRDWARKYKTIYVVTGPLLNRNSYNKIGKNRVSVPEMFFKIIIDIDNLEQKGIAFLIPNKKSELKLSNFVVTIDSIESLSGINFFYEFLDKELEESIESQVDLERWSFDDYKFKKRIESWNHR
jgi:endonuclease G